MSKVVLFSGVHGVGKGYFLKRHLTDKEKFIYCTASSLIEKYKESDDAGYKRVNSVSDNQDVLLKALEVYKNKNILLDGHLCMLNKESKVTRIPERFIIEAQICGIIILIDSAEVIYDRLSQRDDKTLGIEKIIEIQKEEQQYANELKDKYKIKFENVTHSFNRKMFLNHVEGMW